jgi:riboflavin biosynthesis pyrimidine reductase
MRVLFPDSVDDVDVHAFYAADWVETGGLRVNFIASADGAAHATGTSAGLQTAGDNRIFAALRDLADVIVAGAGTATIENYRPVSMSERRRSLRREYGLAEALPIAVISRTLRLDPSATLFRDAPENARTIVLTSEAAPPDRRTAFDHVAEVIICGADTVEPALARRALEERGFTRILSEGGPTVFADLAAGEVVDELCLSVSPLLIGPGPGRITGGGEWSGPARLRLVGVLEEDGALFLRYRVDAIRSVTE